MIVIKNEKFITFVFLVIAVLLDQDYTFCLVRQHFCFVFYSVLSLDEIIFHFRMCTAIAIPIVAELITVR